MTPQLTRLSWTLVRSRGTDGKMVGFNAWKDQQIGRVALRLRFFSETAWHTKRFFEID